MPIYDGIKGGLRPNSHQEMEYMAMVRQGRPSCQASVKQEQTCPPENKDKLLLLLEEDECD